MGKILEVELPVGMARLHYHVQGNGRRSMITFHGFGQTGTDMIAVAEALGEEYTTFHVDIFFHGDSHWPESAGQLDKEHWKKIVSVLLETENIRMFSVAAFSMGGKFALASVESFPTRIEQVILIAPDGIRTSPWYSLATYPGFIRGYFRRMVNHPDRFFRLAHGAHRLGIIDRGMVKFVSNEMNTRLKRRRVYNTWTVFRTLQFDMAHIGRLISENGMDLTIITGKYDRIIQTRHMDRLIRYVSDARSLVIESGHNHLVNRGMREYQQKNE